MTIHVSAKINLALLFLATAGFAANASANEHRFYGSVEAGASYFDYPESRFFAHRGEASPFTRFSNLDADNNTTDAGFGGGLRFGLNFSQAFAGAESSRLELRGSMLDAEQSSTASFFDTGAGVRWGWVRLDNSTGFGTPDDSTLLTNIDQSIEQTEFDLLYALDYKTSGNSSWSIYAGPSFKTLDRDTNTVGQIVTFTTVTLAEELNTDMEGLKLGGSYTRSFGENWAFSIDIAVSRYNSDTDYAVAYSEIYTAGPPLDLAQSLTQDRDVSGYDLELSMTRSFSESVSVTAFSKANYLSSVAHISYGSVPTDPGPGLLSIAEDSMGSWTTGIRINFAF